MQLEKADSALGRHPLNRIIIDIANFIFQQGIKLDAMFYEIDIERKRAVRKRDFIEVVGGRCGVIKMNIASAEEIEEIADVLDFYKTSYVYYIEFCKKIQNTEYRLGGPELPRKVDPAWREKTFRAVAEVLVTKSINLEEILKRFDAQRSGQLRIADFQQAFASLPTKLNPQEIAQIADEFDPRHEGIIFYQRFINTLEDFINKKKVYDETVKKLERFCTEKSVNLEAKVQEVDPRDTKVLTKDDFVRVLQKIGFAMNPIESQTFCDEIAKSKEGFLDLRYLLQKLPKPKALMELPVIYDKIKNYIKTSRQTITQVFAKFDKNGDGNLGPYEFSQALSAMGVSNLSSTEISLLIQDLDKDKDGMISVPEFADKLGMSIDLVQTAVSHEFFRKISRFLKNQGQTIQEFFRKYDYDGNNALSKQELSKMLAILKLDLSQMDIEKLYSEIDVNRDGRVSFMEFSLKYDKAIGAIDKKDDINKQKLIKYLRGKHPKDIFKTRYDYDVRSDVFPVEELRRGIGILGLNFTEIDIDHLIDSITQGKNYALPPDLNEIFSLQVSAPVPISGAKSSSSSHWANKWLLQIKDYCAGQRISVESLLSGYCRESPGRLSMEELGSALDESTISMPDGDKFKLGNELKKNNRDSKIDVNELVGLILGKSPGGLGIVIEAVKNYFERTGKRLEDVMSVDRNGDIYRAELAEALKKINVDVVSSQLEEFVVHLNPEIRTLGITNPSSQKFSARSLATLLKIRTDISLKEAPKVSARLIEQKIIESIYHQIAEGISRKRLNVNKIIADEYDRSGTNKIPTEGFYRLIDSVTDREVSVQNIKILVEDLDSTNTGFVKYQAFLSRVGEATIYKAFADRILIKLKKDVTDANINLTRMFTEPSGYVSLQEIFDAFNRASLRIEKEELKKLCSGLESDDSGKISYKDLIKSIYAAGERSERPPVRYEDYGKVAQGRGEPRYGEIPGLDRDFGGKRHEEGRRDEYGGDFATKGFGEGRRDDYHGEFAGKRFEEVRRDDYGGDFRRPDEPRYDQKKDQYGYVPPLPEVRNASPNAQGYRPVFGPDPDPYRRDQPRPDPVGYRPDSPRHLQEHRPVYGPEPDPYRRDYAKAEPVGYRPDSPRHRQDPSYRHDSPRFRQDNRYDSPRNRKDSPRFRQDPPYGRQDHRQDSPRDRRDRTEGYRQDPAYKTSGFYTHDTSLDRKDTMDRHKSPDYYREEGASRDPRGYGKFQEPGRRDPYDTTERFSSTYTEGDDPYESANRRSMYTSKTSFRALRGPKQHWAKTYIQAIQEYAERKQMSIKQIFQEFDIDRSNSLTPFEFAKSLQGMGLKISQGELQNLMEELDSNQDGRVSLAEFEKIMGKKRCR